DDYKLTSSHDVLLQLDLNQLGPDVITRFGVTADEQLQYLAASTFLRFIEFRLQTQNHVVHFRPEEVDKVIERDPWILLNALAVVLSLRWIERRHVEHVGLRALFGEKRQSDLVHQNQFVHWRFGIVEQSDKT